MGVYIKGMEMPFTCLTCDFHKCAGGVGDFCSLTKRKQFRFKNRPKDCPLIELQPHGRLGDLDSLALLVLNWISTQEKAYSHEDGNALAWRLGAKAMANQIYRDIKAYPTVIPASEEGENAD